MPDIPGDSSTTAVVSVGDTVTNSLETVGDRDWFRLELTAGQEIRIDLSGYGASALEDSYLRIYDSNGNLIYENDDIILGVDRDSTLAFAAPHSGTFYVEVGSYDDAYTGDYQLSVSDYVMPPVGTYDEIADQLVSGFWGGTPRRFDVTQGDSLTVNLTALTPEGQNLAREALALWSDIIGISFVEVSSGAQITFDDNEEGAFAYSTQSGGIISSSHVNVSTQWLTDYGTGLNSYSFQAYIHEIGHALGLGHPGNYDGSATYPYGALFANDAWSTSVMSYFSQTDNRYFVNRGFTQHFAATPMVADILAMQQLYGLSTSTRTSDTVYGFRSTAGRPVFEAFNYLGAAVTIFDSGGIDTLAYDESSSDQRLDLRPGAFSSVDGGVGNLVIAPGVTIENAIGGSGNDVLIGNAADNLLEGGLGDDLLQGGAGIDTASYYLLSTGVTVDLSQSTAQDTGSAGTDTLVSIENIIGSWADDTLIGNNGPNVLDGGNGDDRLFGGGGDDMLDGGAYDNDLLDGGDGQDTANYERSWGVLVNLGITTPQNTNGGGTDTLVSIERVIGSPYEDVITGNAAANVLDGRAGSDSLVGGGGDDDLYGGTGDDRLEGGSGLDRMFGGAGDDVYIVQDASDYLHESAAEGVDRVVSAISYTLRANFEDLTLTGTSAINATGNGLNNTIIGNDAANTINGGAGADSMRGGADNDTYVVDNAGDVVVEASGAGTDTVRSYISYSLGSNVENLVLVGTSALNGTGNSLNNTILGSGAANLINGGAGADSMRGGGGNDTYVVDNAGDVVVELAGEGTDTVRTSVNYRLGSNVENLVLIGTAAIGTGNTLNNTILGNNGANFINGAQGADSLRGGGGNDTYVVDDAGDVVVEASGAGTDTVRSYVNYRLGSNVENLALIGTAVVGTGNNLNNTILGNGSANFLNGAAGADSMRGGAGNDTYVVDDAGDVVVEASGAGTDTVRSYVNYRLGSNVENLVLIGTAAVGTGNTLNNTILGNDSANFLNGAGGADSMRGGGGNDTYVVDNVGDVVVETSGAGTDTVRSYVSYSLAANVENMALIGGSAIDGTGNSLDNIILGNEAANVITGNSGNDSLRGMGGDDTVVGGAGNDTLIGGSGADQFLFDAPLNASSNVDIILDFSVVDDTIVLDQTVFAALTTLGTLSAEAFRTGTAAADADDRIIYDSATGRIYYDADGSGAGGQVLFAQVTAGLALTHADFLVVG